jgi:hypothetical protein
MWRIVIKALSGIGKSDRVCIFGFSLARSISETSSIAIIFKFRHSCTARDTVHKDPG